MDSAFRLFITALPNDEFPLGLLQMCTKVRVARRCGKSPSGLGRYGGSGRTELRPFPSTPRVTEHASVPG